MEEKSNNEDHFNIVFIDFAKSNSHTIIKEAVEGHNCIHYKKKYIKWNNNWLKVIILLWPDSQPERRHIWAIILSRNNTIFFFFFQLSISIKVKIFVKGKFLDIGDMYWCVNAYFFIHCNEWMLSLYIVICHSLYNTFRLTVIFFFLPPHQFSG